MVKLSNGRNVLPNLGKPSWIFSDRDLNSSHSSHAMESKSERLARPESPVSYRECETGNKEVHFGRDSLCSLSMKSILLTYQSEKLALTILLLWQGLTE